MHTSPTDAARRSDDRAVEPGPSPAERRLPDRSSPGTFGFVGAGAITSAIVEGLHVDAADPPAVFLSPRGRCVGRDLASRFPNVQVCDSNQDVLDRAAAIVVAVRPPAAPAVLAELHFEPRHVVISVVAGLRLHQLHEWAAPATRAVRAIPLPPAARAASMTAMYPDDAVARDLFGRVGRLVVPDDEAALDAFSAATATFAAHLDHLAVIADWLTDHGVERGTAAAYTAHVFGELGQSLSQHAGHTDPLATLIDAHMTRGGLNEQFMTDLRRDGVPDVVRRSLDRILARLRGSAGPS